MAIFGKKSDANLVPEPEPGPGPGGAAVAPPYGIADAIQLMRSLPLDQNAQNAELVIRVVRATLASLNVRVHDIIEDAARRQKSIQDGIAALHAQVAELDRHLEGIRREILAQEADLKETTSVKERLLLSERSASAVPTAFAPGASLSGPQTAPQSGAHAPPSPSGHTPPVPGTAGAVPAFFSTAPSLPSPASSSGPRSVGGKQTDRDDPGHGKSG